MSNYNFCSFIKRVKQVDWSSKLSNITVRNTGLFINEVRQVGGRGANTMYEGRRKIGNLVWQRGVRNSLNVCDVINRWPLMNCPKEKSDTKVGEILRLIRTGFKHLNIEFQHCHLTSTLNSNIAIWAQQWSEVDKIGSILSA